MKWLLLAALSMGMVSEYPTPGIREEQTVVVNGRTEVWRLEWKGSPRPFCSASDPGAITCPCQGFAFGERGNMDVVRLFKGREIDRLPINAAYGETEGDGVIVERWRRGDADLKDVGEPEFAASVAKRPVTQVMNLNDYDHDGNSTEFYLQSEARPCGKSYGFVIGVSKTNGRLHSLGTAAAPGTPLYMLKSDWDALRQAQGPTEVIDWHCDDHGSDVETTVRLGWNKSGITAEYRKWTCPGGFKAGKPISN